MTLPFLPSDKQLFLDSEPQWRDGLGEGWKGIKFLGMGSFGVTELWEYQGRPGMATPRPAISQVVVKMAQMFPVEFGPDAGRGALDEGNIGRTVSKFNSPHLIRQFGGNRVGDRFSEMEDVVRIFLEYCPGGSLDALLPTQENQNPKPIAEVDLWGIFECMARAVYAMKRGTEEVGPEAEARYTGNDQELMHCDLKPDNIFFGNRDLSHTRFPIGKIADFGEALFVNPYKNQDDDHGGKYLDRGAPAYKPPEETINARMIGWKNSGVPLNHPRKGTCSNIWQVGAIMNAMILRAHIDFNPDNVNDIQPPLAAVSSFRVTDSARQAILSSQLNHSQGLETKPTTNFYSWELLTLVQECLYREPEFRPKCDKLVEYTMEGLAEARRRISPGGGGPRAGGPPDGPSGGGPPLPDIFDRLPIMTGEYPPEPPTAWDISYVETEPGRFVLEKPPPTGLLGAISGWASRASSSPSGSSSGSLSGWLGRATSSPSESSSDGSSPSPGQRARNMLGGFASGMKNLLEGMEEYEP